MPNNIFKIKKAALFPFNKEMHSILRFEDKLDFEITDVYDTKYSLRVGKNTNKEVKSDSSGHIIKNIEKIDWDSFDTLILGHIDMLILQMKSYDFKNNLISEALRHNKQIYSFDDLGQIVKNNKRVQSPTILPEHLPPFRYEKLHENIVPVVGVFGTGGRQGKFTLQVTLRNCLRNKGFKVGQIGTEPSALLFGMEYVFPIGYNSVYSLRIHDYDVIRYLNETIHKLEDTRCDIILVGSQSASVNIYPNHLYYYNIFQTNFLMGTRPDAIILSISMNDTYEYIEKTISFLESTVECEVIALCLFPVVQTFDWAGPVSPSNIISKESFQNVKKDLYDHFNLPTFLLGEEAQMMDLTNEIISYFSQES